ncbi:MAG TPA: hypothetical protein VFR90_17445 [Methylibium sp.]|uniref:hypothetical protein n=1 Tax=Methylibium sp. TaxID=2067992 RepID=UPI002DB800F3|nr:hypothetical protein [Methylibium sp.]HEU4460909.1 hypothetical protein [Methylibium sp.]
MDPRVVNDRFLMAAHRLAVKRLRVDESARRKASEQLARWRRPSGATRSDAYGDRWQSMLDERDATRLEAAVCAATDDAQVLRSVSPVSVLITQGERMQLLREARRS